MKAIIDADPLVFISSLDSETIDEAVEKFNDKLNDVLADLKEFCEVDDVIICNGGDNSLRKAINDSYKANRKQNPPELLTKLHKEIKLSYQTEFKEGYETDDVVASLWKQEVEKNGEDSVIIVANDKDYKQFPCWYFDMYWARRTLDKIEPLEAINNFYTQMIVGDSADNINYLKGKGKSFAKKLFKDANNEYSYLRRTYVAFLNEYNNKAKEKFNECYSLLKLRTDIYE